MTRSTGRLEYRVEYRRHVHPELIGPTSTVRDVIYEQHDIVIGIHIAGDRDEKGGGIRVILDYPQRIVAPKSCIGCASSIDQRQDPPGGLAAIAIHGDLSPRKQGQPNQYYGCKSLHGQIVSFAYREK
jgi:hypothetical protein